jgi:energy-coupling factor transporter ATP-binding protein EcfA2
MSLLTDILVWATTYLSPWQRDALRRLFQQQELIAQDLDDLYAMLKSARGLPDSQNRQTVPLAQEHVPAQMATTAPVILKAVRDLKHVNRIEEGQQLTFAPKGITVIYGDNASGKSGYSRVLKRACRSREVLETVHPDANDPQATKKIPEAIFDIEVGGHPKSLKWTRDAAPPDELSTIAVFDARCARAYLDEQDVAFLPYGLDIVENLGQRVLPELSRRLSAEISSVNTDTTPFADLLGDTAVGKLIALLGEATRPEQVKALARLTTDEANRLAELDKTLAEIDPKAKAKAVRLSAKRIDGLISRIDTAFACVNDTAVEKLKSCDDETEAALRAETIAAENFRAGEPLLPGTGEPVWKSLFEAARRFSNESAYPSESFPHVCPGARCPLCQEPFNPEAAKRMQRFEEFVKQDTAKVAVERRQQRATAEQKIAQASLGFGLDAATTEELNQLDVTLLQATQEFEKKVETKRRWVLDALKAHAWNGSPALDGDPRTGLKCLSANLLTQANDLDEASDESQRKIFEAERAELRARSSLSPRLKAVLDLIQRMQVKAILTKCKDDLKTRAISDKAKEFASQAVTAALKNALDTEFQVLGVGHVKTKLAERVEKGKMKHKLVLDLPVTTKLDEILSEGEQRAIAISSFLAELYLAGHGGGIVFDDPVSSLDHHRRKQVARRLVEEAKKRQVIVLTHETVFLGELLDAIEQQGVDYLMHHLEWMKDRPGHVSEGLPWEHKSFRDRLDKLEKAQKTMQGSWPAYPNEEERAKMRQQYGLLRATIERIIQDVVFNGVVQRYRDWIRVDRLKDVVGFTEAECKEIARLHKACCEAVPSHDPSSARNAPVPDANQLGRDIEDLKAVVEAIRARRKKGATGGTPGPSP